jgi:hypothetical protein
MALMFHHGSGCVLSAFLSEDIGSVLKGGVKVCQRQLVNEVLVSLVAEFALNLGREAATPIQGALNASFLGCVQAFKLMRHNPGVVTGLRHPPARFSGSHSTKKVHCDFA